MGSPVNLPDGFELDPELPEGFTLDSPEPMSSGTASAGASAGGSTFAGDLPLAPSYIPGVGSVPGEAVEMMKGGAKSAGQTAASLSHADPAIQVVESLAKLTGRGAQVQSLRDKIDAALKPEGAWQERGANLEQVAELAVPEAKIGKLGTLAKGGARFAAGAALHGAHEGEMTPSALAAGGINAAGGAAADVVGKVAMFLKESALRNIVKVLKPSTPIERDAAIQLADRAVKEGITPMGTSLKGATETATQKAASATAERSGIEAGLQGQRLDVAPVLQEAQDAVPQSVTSGRRALPLQQGRSQVKGANAALADVEATLKANRVGYPKSTQVPFEVGQEEKRRLDDLLASFYEGGKANAPVAAQWTKKSADAWRRAIADQFPELGAANLREHELIQIRTMLDRAAKAAQLEGTPIGAMGAAIGAGAVGRMSVPAMVASKLGLSSAPFLTSSAGVKRGIAALLQDSDQLMRFLYLAGAAGVPEHDSNSITDRLATADNNKRLRQMRAVE